MSDKASIGFIGVGNMGMPMCRRLVDAGYVVGVFDIDAAAIDAAAATGARPRSTAAECAAAADVLLTSLPERAHVAATMLESGAAAAALRPGSAWVDLTTNDRELVKRIASSLADDIDVVDCPVTAPSTVHETAR